MKISIKDLKNKYAYRSIRDWFKNQSETDLITIIDSLDIETNFEIKHWFLTRFLNAENSKKYAVFICEKALSEFQKKYPKNNKVKNLLEKAKTLYSEGSEKEKIQFDKNEVNFLYSNFQDVDFVGHMSSAYVNNIFKGLVITIIDSSASYLSQNGNYSILSEIITFGKSLLQEQEELIHV